MSPLPLDTSIVEGQLGHNSDHDVIHAWINTTDAVLLSGSGSPESVVTGAVGVLYRDTTNGTIWEKETGSGNTGWRELLGKTWKNTTAFTDSGGVGETTPAGTQVARVNAYGSFYLGENQFFTETLDPGSFKGYLIGFGFSNKAGRVFYQSARVAELGDPADIVFTRAGPEGRRTTVGLTEDHLCGGYETAAIGQIRMTPWQAPYKGYFAFTVGAGDVATDVCNATAHGWLDGQLVYVRRGCTVGALGDSDTPGNGRFYYMRDVTADTFKLAETLGGTAVDLTSAGSGEIDIPGARDEDVGIIISLRAGEMARDTTGFPDRVVGSEINIASARLGHVDVDDTMRVTKDGNIELGLGSIATGSGLAVIRGYAGRNTKHTISMSGTVSGGTFTLYHYGAPPANPTFHPPKNTDAARQTGAINWNAPATGAGSVQTALEALASIGAGNVTCSGGPLPGTAVVVEFTGTLEKTNFTRLGITTTALTGGGSASVARTQEGLASDATKPLLYMRDNASSPTRTTDYFNVVNASSVSVFRLSSAGRTIVGGDLEVGSSNTTSRLRLPSTANVTTAVGTTGTGAALPATPEVYIRIMAPNAAGTLTTLVIPAYIAP